MGRVLDGAASEGVSLPCQGFARTSGPVPWCGVGAAGVASYARVCGHRLYYHCNTASVGL